MLLGVGGSDPRTTTPRRLLMMKKSRTPAKTTRATIQPTPIPALAPVDRADELPPREPTAPVVVALDTFVDEEAPIDFVSELPAVTLAAAVKNTAALLSSSDSLAAIRSAVGHPALLLHAFDAQHPRNGSLSPAPLQVYHSSVAFVLAHAWVWISA